jgi:tRNA(adenine34) deaminase
MYFWYFRSWGSVNTIKAMLLDDSIYMEIALEEARLAETKGEVPVGACLVTETGEIISRAGNRTINLNDPTGHAEILAIREACEKSENYRLAGMTLYTTLEPCVMCAGAIVNARVRRIVFATRDERYGAARTLYNLCDDPKLNHRLVVDEGLKSEESAQLLRKFFQARRG